MAHLNLDGAQWPCVMNSYCIGEDQSRKRATDLSVMMLGFTVTTSVFTPTSMVYFSEMGGRLHLQEEIKWPNCM